jgi:catechol-2,3-dioxygenase
MSTFKLAHVVLQTNRLAEMRDWYRNLLGARVVYETPGMCFLSFDEEHHRLALVSSPGNPFAERTPATTGMHHAAYTFPDLGVLLRTYAALREQGIEPAMPIQHGVTTSLYYRDPDGNFAELQVDNFESAEDATAYMEGPEFAEDPIGVAFDPARMLAALDEGHDPAQLRTRAWASANPSTPVSLPRVG